jgi:hypothetical protein
VVADRQGGEYQSGVKVRQGRPLDDKERLPRLIIEAAKDGIRDVRYWHKGDMSTQPANVCF